MFVTTFAKEDLVVASINFGVENFFANRTDALRQLKKDFVAINLGDDLLLGTRVIGCGHVVSLLFNWLARREGLEPSMSGPEPDVLPITPPPTVHKKCLR